MTRRPSPFFGSLLLGASVLLGSAASFAQVGAPRNVGADAYTVVLVIGAVVSVILLFAQLKLFSIDSSLKEILKELRKRDGTPPKA